LRHHLQQVDQLIRTRVQEDNRHAPDLFAARPSKAAIDSHKHHTGASLQRAEDIDVRAAGEAERRNGGHLRFVCKESGNPTWHAFVTYDQLAHG
jgi:hypothetical protein